MWTKLTVKIVFHLYFTFLLFFLKTAITDVIYYESLVDSFPH